MSKNMFDTGKNAIIQHTDNSESMPICFSPIFFVEFRRGHDVDVFTPCVNEHRAYERNGVDKILTPRRRPAHSACETEREFVNKAQDVKGRKRNEKRVARI